MEVRKEYERIGMNILMHRRGRGWTQNELAKRAGVSRARISDIERGQEYFTLKTLMKIGKAFDVDYVVLLE